MKLPITDHFKKCLCNEGMHHAGPISEGVHEITTRYEFRGMLHEVTIENSEPLFIPRESHRIVARP